MLEESESLRMQRDDEKGRCHAEPGRQVHRRVQAGDHRLHHLDGKAHRGLLQGAGAQPAWRKAPSGRAADIAGSFPDPPSSTGVDPQPRIFSCGGAAAMHALRQTDRHGGASRSNEMHWRSNARWANVKLPNGRRTRHALFNGDSG